MGDDPELFQEMIGLLRSDAPPLLDALHEAHKAGDGVRLHRAAHTLKGMVAHFGAPGATRALLDLEQQAREGRLEGLDAAVERAVLEITRLDVALEDLRREAA